MIEFLAFWGPTPSSNAGVQLLEGSGGKARVFFSGSDLVEE